ncbi:MAG: hypothetical protein WAM60_04515 [Candidatus Promineifilaceae bacterium]
MKSYKTGIFGDLFFVITPSAVIASAVLWLVLTLIAIYLLDVAPVAAVIGSLLAVALHWMSELWHQKGHAVAARRTGYPMVGVRLWTLLGASLYPRDEPALSADVHIQRALGGPIASLILVPIALVLLFASNSAGGVPLLLAKFFLLENTFVFFLGAFLPLGFTDGSTLLQYWGKRS